MKRSGELKRRTPLKAGKPLSRGGGGLDRSGSSLRRTRVRARNPERKAETYARNFGERGDAVRAMRCLVAGCRYFPQACHARARQMGGHGGDRRSLVPLCDTHHRESSEFRTSARAAFERRTGLDLVAEAERIALELDERGLP